MKFHEVSVSLKIGREFRIWANKKINTCSLCLAGFLGGSDSGEEPLEEEMVTHSSILAWRFPWTEEHGRLQSMGLQRIRHD